MPKPFEYETQVAGGTINIYGDGWEFHDPACSNAARAATLRSYGQASC
jgi:hypothetical protein